MTSSLVGSEMCIRDSRLVINDEQAGKELYSLLTKGEYIRTFNQEAPTLDEIFKMKVGETIA